MYKLLFHPQARRAFLKLSGTDFDRIDGALERLQSDSRPYGIKKLGDNMYRIRVGNWRIIYSIDDKERLIIIGRIARRSEDTYDKIEDLF